MAPPDAALAALDPDAIARDTASLVRIASLTGEERPALELLAELADGLGLRADLHRHAAGARPRRPTHRARRPRRRRRPRQRAVDARPLVGRAVRRVRARARVG